MDKKKAVTHTKKGAVKKVPSTHIPVVDKGVAKKELVKKLVVKNINEEETKVDLKKPMVVKETRVDATNVIRELVPADE